MAEDEGAAGARCACLSKQPGVGRRVHALPEICIWVEYVCTCVNNRFLFEKFGVLTDTSGWLERIEEPQLHTVGWAAASRW